MNRTFLLISYLALALPAQAAIIDLDMLGSTTRAAAETRQEERQIEAVVVESAERGHLLALVPLEIPLKVKALATGDVTLTLPWYANFSVMSRSELLTELKAAVSNALHLETLSTVRAEGPAVLPTFSTEEASAVEEAIRAVLEND